VPSGVRCLHRYVAMCCSRAGVVVAPHVDRSGGGGDEAAQGSGSGLAGGRSGCGPPELQGWRAYADACVSE